MKKISILLCLFGFISFAQERNKLFINVGPSFYTHMKENQRNFNIGASFHHQTKNEKWSMEYYYLYSKNDYFPDFYKDSEALDQYVFLSNPATVFEDTKWDKVVNHEIGAKLHYVFFKNNKINLSFNLGLGVKKYNEKLFRLLSIDTDQNNVIFRYEWIEFSGQDGYGAGLYPGVHFDYKILNNFLVSIDGGYHQDIVSKAMDYNGTFWNFSLGIGKKF